MFMIYFLLLTLGLLCSSFSNSFRWRVKLSIWDLSSFLRKACIAINFPLIHLIKSGSIAPQCMESSAFNDAAWNPLHSIGMVWAMLHKIHCIQSECIGPLCMDSTALHLAAWTPLHYISLHGILCIQ